MIVARVVLIRYGYSIVPLRVKSSCQGVDYEEMIKPYRRRDCLWGSIVVCLCMHLVICCEHRVFAGLLGLCTLV